MSKFSTDDLIDFLDDVCGVRDSWGKDIETTPVTIVQLVGDGKPHPFKAPDNRYDGSAARKAIIARLRAADALCEEMEGAAVAFLESGFPQTALAVGKVIRAYKEAS